MADRLSSSVCEISRMASRAALFQGTRGLRSWRAVAPLGEWQSVCVCVCVVCVCVCVCVCVYARARVCFAALNSVSPEEQIEILANHPFYALLRKAFPAIRTATFYLCLRVHF